MVLAGSRVAGTLKPTRPPWVFVIILARSCIRSAGWVLFCLLAGLVAGNI